MELTQDEKDCLLDHIMAPSMGLELAELTLGLAHKCGLEVEIEEDTSYGSKCRFHIVGQQQITAKNGSIN